MPVVTGGSSGPAPVELSAALAQEPSAAPAGEPSAAPAHEPSATLAPGYGIRIRNYMTFEKSDNPSHLFSAGHIRQLTVQDALELEFPQLCSSEFELLGFSDLVHEEDMLRVGELRLYIPSLNEIRSALADAPIQYGRYGKRSVRVRFRGKQLLTSEVADVLTGHIGIEYPLHFRELRRWSNAHLLRARVECARHVLETIRHEQLLTAEECDVILQEAWDRPLRGFRDGLDRITLSHLHELLDENWLGERLIDCILQLFSSQLNRHTPNLIRFLDSAFHMELRNGYRTRRASPLLTKLREEFLVDPPVIIAFLLNKQDCHWAPTSTILELRTVFQGDSGAFLFDEDLRAMVQWWLQDIAEEDGVWEARELPVERQDARSGSCGLASISATAKFARQMEETLTQQPLPELSFALWTNQESHAVRSNWLQVILRAHLTSTESQSQSVRL